MKPVKPDAVPGYTEVEFARNQPEYQPLPALISCDGRENYWPEVISCWRLSLAERLKLLFSGRLFIRMLPGRNGVSTRPLTPVLPHVEKPAPRGRRPGGR